MTNLEKFLAHKPTLLMTICDFNLWEHPLRGDEAPIYMTTLEGRLINTGFYDLDDFDLELCIELAGE